MISGTISCLYALVFSIPMANSLLQTQIPPHQEDGLVTNNAPAAFLPTTVNPPPSAAEEKRKCDDLKVQVIDDTALIDQGKLIKVDKKPKRRVRKARKKKEVSSSSPIDKPTSERRGLSIYSRKEMEALRFERLEDQKRKWIEVYCGLDPLVAREYDGLLDSTAINHHLKNCVPRFNFDPRPPVQKSANLFAVAAMVKANPLIITAH